MGIAAVHAEMDSDPVSKGKIGLQAVQPRVGVYAGVAYPRDGMLRIRASTHFDVVLDKIRAAGTEQNGLPDLPRFAWDSRSDWK